jgi:hypothetical protein
MDMEIVNEKYESVPVHGCPIGFGQTDGDIGFHL